MIQVLGKLRDHYWRVLRMASTIGLDLVAIRKGGHLSSHDWAEIVTACRGCEWADKCDVWVNRSDMVQCAPSTCVNRKKFEMLRRKQAG